MFSFFSNKKRVVGFDIKNEYIRFVEIFSEGEKQKITSYGEVIFESPVFEFGQIKDELLLKESLSKIKEQIKTNDVFISLPHDQVKFFKFNFHKLKSSEARESLENFLRAKNLMTFDEEVFYFRTSVIKAPIQYEYTVFVGNKKLLRLYKDIFKNLHYRIKGFVSNQEALFNSSVPFKSETSFMILCLEKNVSSILVYSPAQKPFYTDFESVSHSIISAINRVYIDWYDAHKEKLHHTLIVGSEAGNTDLVDKISKETRIHFSPVNIFLNTKIETEHVPLISKEDSRKYAIALGVSIQDLD